tara:strand:- start:522 stop:1154 length:633 start_codon:yes stop_codon:yes gene_type:complete
MSKIDCLVVGYGGSGESYFMKKISEIININDLRDRDGLKHMPHKTMINLINKLKFKKNLKIIYVFSNPFKAICSLFRRGWGLIQYKKISKNKITKKQNYYLKNINNFLNFVDNEKTDLFSIQSHFYDWIAHSKYPIYFLDMENLDNEADNLKQFLNLNEMCQFNDWDCNKRSDYSNLILKHPNAVNLYNKLYDNMKKSAITHNNIVLQKN